MNAPLTLEQAATLVEKLGEANINTVMVSLTGADGNVYAAREHHVALAPGQNFDVMALTDVLRALGYSLNFIEVAGENQQRGFVITPPPTPVEEAEEVVEPDRTGWRCALCGYDNGERVGTCRRCGTNR